MCCERSRRFSAKNSTRSRTHIVPGFETIEPRFKIGRKRALPTWKIYRGTQFGCRCRCVSKDARVRYCLLSNKSITITLDGRHSNQARAIPIHSNSRNRSKKRNRNYISTLSALIILIEQVRETSFNRSVPEDIYLRSQ